ncbi:nonribosomal peptide ligase subunit [Paenibacillus larvae subsp. larvae DSM 25430]|uniref:Nonribosomal peptide ligase subunit n=2 Tax=Paenibacillus larvae TaxID=1464 RepID=V9W984_9BACL|nr:non-ribosomal peptide synthetase [Paenibacillus larvae]AHD05677.1 nonribosomal peptide ligase subunit [Paenibacillus larvae subsp. larvae DSM 25430]AVG12222.1 nonribosomal peptide ligase subunit [Paenibacillus larvae subsp. larvae DSM 25430]MDR5570118.1 non-ribosomal peptide synthetase [Paenibacillus larvae]MDR5595970.1 non-ribosomal peptide synthetase [Paenibacillus larvae]
MSEFKQQELFWSRMFDAGDRLVTLPSFKISEPEHDSLDKENEYIYRPLRSDISQRIMTMTNKSPMAIYLVLLVGIECLLYKYTGEDSIILGVPTIEEETDEDLRLNQVLLLKQKWNTESTFKSIFNEMKHTLGEALSNQHIPFDKMTGNLKLNYDSNHLPMINTIVSLNEIQPIHFKDTVVTDTLFQFDLENGTINVKLAYNQRVYDKAFMIQVIEHLNHIFSILLYQPELKISQLDILPDTERNSFLVEFNKTVSEYPADKTVYQLFEAQSERTPDQAAVIHEDGQLTYRQLNERANGLARTLRTKGVQADQLVAIISRHSTELITGILAVLKAGGAYVPIDPEYPEERIQYMLKDSKAEIVLTQRDIRQHLIYEGTIVLLDEESSYHEDCSNLEPASTSDNLAYVIYTSGSTGKPKGVLIEHRGLINYIWWASEVYVKGEKANFPLYSPISFDLTVTSVFTPLITGGTVIVYGGEDKMALLSAIMQDSRINIIKLTPAHLHVLKEMDLANGSTIRKMIVGGENLSTRLAQSIYEQFANGLELFNEYGPTETVVGCMIYRYDPKQDRRESVPIGKPAANTNIYVLDQHMKPVPAGIPGEMYISGAGVARGYLNRSELTTERFVNNPFVPGTKMYRTGDLARWLPDGNMEYIGRVDHQVKIRGYRIETGEVESALIQLPSIQDAVVVAKENSNGETCLCAYYTADDFLTVSDIRKELSRKIPSYMIPAYLIPLKAMPLTSNGKLDRNALPSPEGNVQSGMKYAAPVTKLEKILVSVWETVLGVKRVGVLDNFFELGGDSIKSIQVTSRLYQAGYKFEIKYLFKYPTISGLVPYIKPVSRIAEQGEIKGDALLTPIQHWFFDQNMPDLHHYNQAVMLYWKQGLNESWLREIMEKICRHHDALRMVFVQTEHGYQARNRGLNEGELFSLEVVSLHEEQHITQAIEQKSNEIQRSIHLAKGPLIKLGLFQCEEGDHLLIVIHHLVIDGVSWRILLEDMAIAYEQLLKGESIQLPKKTDSYLLWAEQLSQYAANTEFTEKNQYWLGHEAGLTYTLPKDFTEEDRGITKDKKTITVQWSTQETEQLLKKANRAFNTEMNDLLLTGLGTAIHHWTGYEKILIHLEGHGREPILSNIDITRTVGWFTNQYPVPIRIEPGQDLSYWIKSVKESLRKIPQKGMGYGILKYLSHHKRDAELTGYPEISFNYLGQFDQDFQNRRFELSPYSSGKIASENHPVPYVLDINGMISNGQLSLAISYSRKQYRKETIEKLAGLLKTGLSQVIKHCISQEKVQLTPSDISLKEVTIEELDQFVKLTRHLGEIENIYPLTPMQKGMLFHSLIDTDSEAYFEQAEFELKGPLNIDSFIKSLEQLTERYDILRTNFYAEWKDEPLQIIFRNKKMETLVEDIRSLNGQQQNEFIDSFKINDKARGFDLTRDALMRVSILRTEDARFRFIWSFHHILMDGWCLPLITKEVFETYYAILEQRRPERASITPYSQYIEWLDKQDQEKASAYWRDYLVGYEEQTVVLQAKPLLKAKGYKKERLVCHLGKQLTEEIKLAASQNQVTLNTWVQTAWGLLLQRYNNSRDVVFGSVVSGRPAEIPGVEKMVGLFINTIPVRIQCPDEMTTAQLLKMNQDRALASRQFDMYPLYETQAQSKQKQSLISHIMVFENYPVEKQMGDVNHDDTALEILQFKMEEHTHYDFSLNVMPDEEMDIHFVYNANVYDRPGVERIREDLVHILSQMVNNPERSVKELDMLAVNERKVILKQFNDTRSEYPMEKTIHQLFEEQTERSPDQIAVIFEKEKLTYRQLNERANRLARTLREAEVRSDQLVGLMADRSLEMVIGVLAILKAGGAYVPISPDYPEEHIRYMLEDSETNLLLVQHHLQGRVAFAGKMMNLNDPEIYGEDGSNLEPISGPKSLAYVIYTSGSTGKPKGVMVEHHSVVNRLWWMQENYPVYETDTILQKTTFTFDVSVWELFWWSIAGSKVCLLTAGGEKDPKHIVETIAEQGITTMHFVPAMLHAFLDYVEQLSNGERKEKLGTLRQVFASGEALPPQHVARFHRLITPVNQVKLINLYGPTEATVDVSYFDCQADREYDVIPIGKPISNIQIYMVGNESEQLQPVGVAGELCISGVGLARGYLNRPELTAEKFVDNPFVPGEKMYRTGDLARWLPDGNIKYLGRIDNQVKIRGYRIELGEVESALLDMESVQEAVVTAWGEDGSKQLCAYLVGDPSIETIQFRQQLLRRFPEYMIPAYFVRLEELPLTLNGKIYREALPAPEGRMKSGTEYTAPRTSIEKQLSEIWKEVLANPNLGIHDNFFEAGGHSLKVLQLINKINAVVGTNIQYPVVYQAPTIEKMAYAIQAATLESKTDNPFIKLNQNGSVNLFCFPPLIGYGLVYNEMANRLDGDCIVYATDFLKEPSSYEQMIDQYAEYMIRIQNQGPYLLLGYSSGSNLAFEVTKALEQKGCTVSDIIMLDSRIRDSVAPLTSEDIEETIQLNMEIIPDYYKEILTIPSIQEKMKSFLTYQNQLINSGVIKANIHHFICDDLTERGWSQATMQNYREYELIGTHIQILDPEYIEDNVQKLRSIIKEIIKLHQNVLVRS